MSKLNFVQGTSSLSRVGEIFLKSLQIRLWRTSINWLKSDGGIDGITQLDSSRDRWCITYNEKARFSDDTLALFDLQHRDTNNDWRHRGMGHAGLKCAELDVQKLQDEFIKFKVFSNSDGQMMSLSTGDVATDDIMTDILKASGKG